MSETNEAAAKPSRAGAAAAPPMQTWRKVLVVVAVLSAVGGLGLELFGSADPVAADGALPVGGAGLMAEGGARAQSSPPSPGGSTWAPYLVRGGFSFLVAFCVGLALRKSLRVGAFLVGIAVLGTVGLHYAGVIDLDWIAIRAEAADLAERLEGRVEGFLDFLKRSLPTTVAGAAGLGVGFWRS